MQANLQRSYNVLQCEVSMAEKFDIKQVENELLYNALKKQYEYIMALVLTIEFLEKRIKQLTQEPNNGKSTSKRYSISRTPT